MHRHTTWVLLILAALVGAAIYILDPPRAPVASPGPSARPGAATMPRLIDRLRIEAGGTAVECVRDGEGWRLVAPLEGPADPAAVRRILDGFGRMPLTDTITAADRENRGTTWREYGLDAPRARLTFSGNGAETVLALGRTGPLGSLYIRAGDGHDILVTTTNLLALLPGSAADLRDRTLFTGDASRLRRIDLRRPAGFVRLERDEQGRWQVRQPVASAADPVRIAALLEELTALRVAEFVEDNAVEAAPYGFDETGLDVALDYEDPDRPAAVLQIGRPLERNPTLVYARFRRSPAVFAVPSALTALATLPLDDLRDHRLIPLRADEVSGLDLERDGRRIELRREGDRWRITAPVQAEADALRIRALVGEWLGTRAEAFIDTAAATTNAPAGVVSPTSAPPFRIVFHKTPAAASAPATTNATPPVVTSLAPTSTETLVTLVFETAPTAARPVVRRLEDGAGFVIAPKKPQWCGTDPLQYRSRIMLEFPPAAVRRVELVRGTTTQIVERKEGGDFTAVNATNAAPTLARLRLQMEALSKLRATDLVASAPADPSAFGLEPPSASLTLAFAGAEGVVKTLLIGRATTDGVYAAIRGQGVVFILDTGLAALMQADLYTAAAVSLPVSPAAGTNAVPVQGAP